MSSEAEAQDAAAAKIQEANEKKKAMTAAQEAVEVKKSRVWQALGRNDAAMLKAALAACEPAELGLHNSDGLSLLAAALKGGAPLACAEAIVAYVGASMTAESLAALGYPDAKELGCWARVQAALKVAADPEAEEPPDVNDEEWQATLAGELGFDKLDVKRIITIGLYAGGRAPAPEHVELSFDGELQPRQGYGVFLGPTGDMYVGSFMAGARDGLGALYLKAGGTYVGAWKGGKRHGVGRGLAADGSVYEGDWKFNKRHGRGTYTYTNGDAYTGAWFAGTKHGAGRYKAVATGAVTEGTWQNGVLKAAKVGGTDGSAFYGAFDPKGRPSGAGAYVFPSGAMVKGAYTAPPAAEDADEEASAPVEPATWKGGATGAADHVADGVLKASLCAVPSVTNVIIVGAPASGKGTQCEKISAALGLVHVSTGDMLRAATEDPDNEVGQKAKELMEAGELVPDTMIFDLVKQRLTQPDAMTKGWLLDGFPRTAGQAALMEEGFLVPSKVIVLEVPDEVLLERVTGRRLDPETGTIYHLTFNPPSGDDKEEVLARLTQRGDDTEEALKKRLLTFGANKDAVEAAFAPILKKIEGNKSAEAVWTDVLAALRS